MRTGRTAFLVRSLFVVSVILLGLGARADVTGPASRSPTTTSSVSVPIPSTPDADQALSRFRAFTEIWMDRLRAASALQTVAARSSDRTLKRFSVTYTEEVRSTGSASNPYVGILHYTEELYRCPGPAETTCTMVESTPVTEIFRYQKGAWVY